MNKSKPEIVIAGAGGMGALFGAILQDGGLPVTLYDTNKTQVDTINTRGLNISGFGGDRTVYINATSDPESITSANIILFQCKSHGTRVAALALKHLVDGGAICISFQNGLGNEEVIAEVVGNTNVLGGLTAMAGYLLAPGHIRDFSRVPSTIGEMTGGASARVNTIASALSNAGLETHASENIVQAIWTKLLGNIAMSAVSGAVNLTSAQCLQVPALKQTSLRALDEALSVAAHQGILLDRETVVAAMALISQSGGTGDNKSSLCVDLLNRRPTEVEYIYGSVINLARTASIDVPTLETLSSIVRGLESHYLETRNESI